VAGQGRPRKVKAQIDVTDPLEVASASAVTDQPAPPPTHCKVDNAPGKIDQSHLMFDVDRQCGDNLTGQVTFDRGQASRENCGQISSRSQYTILKCIYSDIKFEIFYWFGKMGRQNAEFSA
jgi:hypothetical protein